MACAVEEHCLEINVVLIQYNINFWLYTGTSIK